MSRTGRRLSELASEIPIYPQVLVNVRVPHPEKMEKSFADIGGKTKEIEKILNDNVKL